MYTYRFDFDWGECWYVSEVDFNWDVEYWCKVLARHIHFFRVKIADVKPVEIITTVEISKEGLYVGLLSVSDNFVHVMLHGKADYSWRVEEL